MTNLTKYKYITNYESNYDDKDVAHDNEDDYFYKAVENDYDNNVVKPKVNRISLSLGEAFSRPCRDD